MKILFVCHGNVCRSPTAEFVMKDILKKAGLDDVVVESAAMHADEIGNDVHYGTRRKPSAGRRPHVRPTSAMTSRKKLLFTAAHGIMWAVERRLRGGARSFGRTDAEA